MEEKQVILRHTALFTAYLFVFWGFYRLLFVLPDPFDIVLLEPVFWLAPLYIFLKEEKACSLNSLDITAKNLPSTFFLSIVLSVPVLMFGIVLNALRYGGAAIAFPLTQWDYVASFVLVLVAAISEEVAFRGYYLKRVENIFGSRVKANLFSSLVWVAIYAPLAILDWKLSISGVLLYSFIFFIYSLAVNFFVSRLQNIFIAVSLHVALFLPLILFR